MDVIELPLKRPQLEDLQFTTIAMMMYSNTVNDPAQLMELIRPYPIVDVPRTKKKQSIDKKKIRAPYGSIISARYWNTFKGLCMVEDVRLWCVVTCQLTMPHPNDYTRTVKINTLEEVYTPVPGQPDTFTISYHCSHCNQDYTIDDVKSAITFRNQIQLDVSLGDYNINVMMFRDSFKIVGCKSFDDGFKFMDILLNHVHFDKRAIWPNPEMGKDEHRLEFECRTTMLNTKFYIGVPIDREKLKQLLNRPEHQHVIKLALDESTSNPQVKTYIYGLNTPTTKDQYRASTKEVVTMYPYVRYQLDTTTHTWRRSRRQRPYMKYIHNECKPSIMSFVTFSSSQTIISGSNVTDIEYAIHKFYDIIEPHMMEIREVLRRPTEPLVLEKIPM